MLLNYKNTTWEQAVMNLALLYFCYFIDRAGKGLGDQVNYLIFGCHKKKMHSF